MKLAVVGATGLVGRTVLKVLEEKHLPFDTYVFFSSQRSAGTQIIFQNTPYTVQLLEETSFDQGFDYAIFCAGGTTSKKFAPIAASKGCIVVDNSSAFRMEPSVPLVVPQVNAHALQTHHNIIANPNCSTIQAVVALKPLEEQYGIQRIIYSTYQAVSGAGRNGVADLEKGITHFKKQDLPESYTSSISLPSETTYTCEKFPYPIFNNCLPHIDVFLENGYTKEEEKMIQETRKILERPNLKVTATTVRVPVMNSHSESICVELQKEFTLQDVKHHLAHTPGLHLVDAPFSTPPLYPIATMASGQDNVLVGRVRRDESVENGLHLWVVADNIRKGAASNAVEIVEYMMHS